MAQKKQFILFAAITFFALECEGQATGTFTDSRDGKTYKTVELGTQTWIAENFAYTGVKGYSKGINGNVYTWEAANNMAPSGWHLPSKNEWKELIKYLRKGTGSAYQKLKNNSCNFNATYEPYRSESFSAVSEGEWFTSWTATRSGLGKALLFYNGWYTITSYTRGSTGNKYPMGSFGRNSINVRAFVRFIKD